MTNPLGAVCIFDGENPRTFSAKARQTISGGWLVVVSGAANVVGSPASTYTTGDIIVDPIAGEIFCNGIALNNAGSDELVTVATRGAYLMRSAGVISGGQDVIPRSGIVGEQGVMVVTSGTDVGHLYDSTIIGRAMTASASGTNLFALVSLNC